MNAWAFGGSRFDQLVRLADTTEINALVIGIKTAEIRADEELGVMSWEVWNPGSRSDPAKFLPGQRP